MLCICTNRLCVLSCRYRAVCLRKCGDNTPISWRGRVVVLNTTGGGLMLMMCPESLGWFMAVSVSVFLSRMSMSRSLVFRTFQPLPNQTLGKWGSCKVSCHYPRINIREKKHVWQAKSEIQYPIQAHILLLSVHFYICPITEHEFVRYVSFINWLGAYGYDYRLTHMRIAHPSVLCM